MQTLGVWKPVEILIGRLGTFLAAATLSLALGAMSAQVFYRYFLGDSIIWAEELARYALLWSAMIGAAVAYRQGAHVAVGALWNLLPGAVVQHVWRLIHLIVIAFAAVMVWQGWFLSLRNFARHQLSPALQIEIAWMYLAIPFGGLLIALAAAEAFWFCRKPAGQ